MRLGKRGPLAAPAPERRPQARVAALVGEREQRILVEPDQRALEHRGQRQVVARQQAEFAERDQVHDRELLGQHHAVDPRHRHAARLEGAEQVIDEGPAAAHQHQHVAGPDRAAAGLQPAVAAFGRRLLRPPGHAVRDERRQTRGRVVGLLALHRQRPWLGGSRSSGVTTGGHSSTRPPAPTRCTWWRMGTASAVTPARASGRANTASTAASTAPVERKDSAKGSDSHGLSAASARLWNCRWAAASARASAPWKLKIDCFSSPTAKRVRGAARAPSPAKNSSANAAITAHWVGAGVLRLVDQQVVEAAVELVEHPGARCPRGPAGCG